MFVIRKEPPSFADVAGQIAKSTIVIAVGTRSDGTPNIVGSGFAAEFSELFVTCWHVAAVQDDLGSLDQHELNARGLRDTILRTGLLDPQSGYVWRDQKPFTWLRFGSPENDVCIYRTNGIAIPPLFVRKDDQVMLGEEVGICGFPMGNQLQGSSTRPFVDRTVVAGVYDGDDGTGVKGAKVAIATAAAGGYSGGPIFAAGDGALVGMVSSKMLEPAGYPAGISLGIAATTIWQLEVRAAYQSADIIANALVKSLGPGGDQSASSSAGV